MFHKQIKSAHIEKKYFKTKFYSIGRSNCKSFMDVKLIYLDGFVVLCLDVQSQVATAVCVVIANMTLLVSDLVVHLFHVAFHLVLSN